MGCRTGFEFTSWPGHIPTAWPRENVASESWQLDIKVKSQGSREFPTASSSSCAWNKELRSSWDFTLSRQATSQHLFLVKTQAHGAPAWVTPTRGRLA